MKPTSEQLDGYNYNIEVEIAPDRRYLAEKKIMHVGLVAPDPLTMIFRYCPRCREHIYVARNRSRKLAYLAIAFLALALPASFLVMIRSGLPDDAAAKTLVVTWMLLIGLTLLAHEALWKRQRASQLRQAVARMKESCTHASDPLILERKSKRSVVVRSSNEP